jgi:hypothetical protein
MTTPPRRQHAGPFSRRTPALIRLVQTSDLPDGVNALASADGGTIIVRAGLDRAERRRAVRAVLAPRLPGFLVFPALAGLHLRRALICAAEGVSRLVQSAAALLTPDSPAVVLLAGAAVVAATAAGGAAMILAGQAPHGAHAPAQAAGSRGPGGSAGLRRAPARPGHRPGPRPAGSGHGLAGRGPVPSPRPGTTPAPGPSGSLPAQPLGPITSPATSLLHSLLPSPPVPVPVPSVSVSASLPPLPVPLPSPSPACIQLGPVGACLTP